MTRRYFRALKAVGSGWIWPICPGHVVAPNISPDPEAGAGTWTDDQLARAIREGIDHDGRALFPMMPYEDFRHISDEDVAAIVVYLRSLPPVHNHLSKTEISFPVKYLIRSVPEPLTSPVAAPYPADCVKYGRYLVKIDGCADCHTLQDQGQPIAGFEFASGWLMRGPWGEASTANITPDPSGISYYDEVLFIEVMRTGYVKARKLSSIMPCYGRIYRHGPRYGELLRSGRNGSCVHYGPPLLILEITTVRLNVEENQLANVFGEFCVCVGSLKSA